MCVYFILSCPLTPSDHNIVWNGKRRDNTAFCLPFLPVFFAFAWKLCPERSKNDPKKSRFCPKGLILIQVRGEGWGKNHPKHLDRSTVQSSTRRFFVFSSFRQHAFFRAGQLPSFWWYLPQPQIHIQIHYKPSNSSSCVHWAQICWWILGHTKTHYQGTCCISVAHMWSGDQKGVTIYVCRIIDAKLITGWFCNFVRKKIQMKRYKNGLNSFCSTH